MNYKNEQIIVGKTIHEVWIKKDGSYLVLVGDVPFFFYSDGDCCSHTWIHEINGRDALRGSAVTAVENKGIELPGDIDDRDNCECIQSYCMTITTAKGRCDIIYRNESNGYYGGDLEYIDFDEKGYGILEHLTILEEFKTKKEFKLIEEDHTTIV